MFRMQIRSYDTYSFVMGLLNIFFPRRLYFRSTSGSTAMPSSSPMATNSKGTVAERSSTPMGQLPCTMRVLDLYTALLYL